MGFFERGDDPDPEQAESLERIEGGGIPRRVEERLKGLATEGSLFTSGLSVNEFALLGRLGPEPIAQVMGASVVRTGWQYLPALDPGTISFTGTPWSGPTPTGRALANRYTEASAAQVRNYQWLADVVCELGVLTDAWNTARRRAVDRLREEALQVGADVIVGVRLQRSDHDFGKGTIEYVVTGTAIRLPGSAGTAWPIVTDVSVQDYWRLHSSGHEPVGFVATTTVVFASPPRSTRLRRLRTTSQNQELEELSRGFHAARQTVRARLLGQLSDAHAVGAVGVEISHSVHREKFALASSLASEGHRGWHVGRFGLPYRVSGRTDIERRGWVITMHAAGTAIRPQQGASEQSVKTAMRMGSR
ncbi:MAG: heavy metal-binding domain-containing protein [Actinomycetota bacterium]|nr:heavy metal-binding domain-containing protein [Actinomycetota bacterium]